MGITKDQANGLRMMMEDVEQAILIHERASVKLKQAQFKLLDHIDKLEKQA